MIHASLWLVVAWAVGPTSKPTRRCSSIVSWRGTASAATWVVVMAGMLSEVWATRPPAPYAAGVHVAVAKAPAAHNDFALRKTVEVYAGRAVSHHPPRVVR